MGDAVELEASDGHRLQGYRAEPSREAQGAVVVLQEIFGVNRHIRSICDRLAGEGYIALTPAVFDRIQRGFHAGYSDEEVATARGFLSKVDWDAMLLDVEAASAALKGGRPVSAVGFCLGGSLAYLAAVRQKGLAASVCFYGGKIVAHAEEAPLCPTQMHFGEEDQGIPMSDVDVIRESRQDCEIYTYPAGHGFNCDERGSYHPGSANLAWERTLAFLKAHGAARTPD